MLSFLKKYYEYVTNYTTYHKTYHGIIHAQKVIERAIKDPLATNLTITTLPAPIIPFRQLLRVCSWYDTTIKATGLGDLAGDAKVSILPKLCAVAVLHLIVTYTTLCSVIDDRDDVTWC